MGGFDLPSGDPARLLSLTFARMDKMAMAVAVASGELRSLGEIEDIEIPPLAFVYAMAGLFRPPGEEVEAYAAGEDSVLVYSSSEESRIYFFVRSGRLRRVEERYRSRTVHQVKVEWADSEPWPAQAEYRDLRERSRVRWDMHLITTETESHPGHIFDLPPVS